MKSFLKISSVLFSLCIVFIIIGWWDDNIVQIEFFAKIGLTIAVVTGVVWMVNWILKW